ncbi:bifunctional UDP-N-acetylglucosamine diphosphorylase/glucosamine-1-phosphate N-acetyltransferase GlmU [Bacteriovoracaceae bacterium]|nr:bifunctional UDP-N-acetylglucosamine diphosphorylase/glucosamine-1-phosphate N-acetyltransferase GlmU [Bacteriovoracaceae bacterium]
MKDCSIGSIILAAGKGTRFKSDVPKVMAPLLGKKVIDYIGAELNKFSEKINQFEYGLVVGHQKELLQEHLKGEWNHLKKINFATQEQQLGTGHAVKTFIYQFEHYKKLDYVIIMCGDTPLLKSEIFERLYHEISKSDSNAVVATFETDNPHGYGRIIRSEEATQIIEQKDSTPEQALVNEVNSGLYIVKASYLFSHIEKIKSENAAGEFYLTDLFSGQSNIAYCNFEKTLSFSGINTLAQLSQVRSVLIQRLNSFWMDQGVDIIDPQRTIIEPSVCLSEGTILYPNVRLSGLTSIGINSIIEDGCVINNSKVGNSVKVLAYSYLEKAEVNNKAAIGPYARLRPGANIGEECKVGNFVEIKKAKLDKGSKVSHLSYVGDAEIGEETNIGCGFITCNYDGANKHLTKIGKNSFIGSDVQMVAPVDIGNDAYVGSGSTINKNVPDGAFAIARERQVTKEGMAKKFIKNKKK